MFIGYAQNHTGGTYRMLNLSKKLIIIIRDVICLNKKYGEYVSRKENNKLASYILQDKDRSYNWANVKKWSL